MEVAFKMQRLNPLNDYIFKRIMGEESRIINCVP